MALLMHIILRPKLKISRGTIKIAQRVRVEKHAKDIFKVFISSRQVPHFSDFASLDITPAIEKIIIMKKARAWVSTVWYLKKEIKIII